MLNWEGYMSTYNSLAPHIQFSKPSFPGEIDRLQVWRDYRAARPNTESLSRAIGGLAAHVPTNVFRNCMESAIWPGRMDFDASYRDAYKEK